METEMKGRAHSRQRERVGHRPLTKRPRSYSAPRTRVWWNRENHRGAFTRLS